MPQKHVGGAAGGTAGGPERSADDRTHGTGARCPSLPPGLHPRDRAGYRVSIPRRLRRCGCRASMPGGMHPMAGVVVILVACRAVRCRHCRTRRARHQGGRNDRQNLRRCSHRYLRQACQERLDAPAANAPQSNRVPRVVVRRAWEKARGPPKGGYCAAAASGCCAALAGRLALRNARTWRSASWICSGFAFQG